MVQKQIVWLYIIILMVCIVIVLVSAVLILFVSLFWVFFFFVFCFYLFNPVEWFTCTATVRFVPSWLVGHRDKITHRPTDPPAPSHREWMDVCTYIHIHIGVCEYLNAIAPTQLPSGLRLQLQSGLQLIDALERGWVGTTRSPRTWHNKRG